MISSAGSVGPQQNFAYKSHSRSSLWSISWLCHQMFYPYVRISAAQARESDNLRHALMLFSLCLSSFLGTQRILGYVRPGRIVAVHQGEEGASGGAFRLRRLCEALWRNWPSNAPLKDADPVNCSMGAHLVRWRGAESLVLWLLKRAAVDICPVVFVLSVCWLSWFSVLSLIPWIWICLSVSVMECCSPARSV